MCKVLPGLKIKEVEELEEATTTTENVLCRRSQEVHFQATESERKALKASNEREGLERRRDYLSQQLKGVVGQKNGISATPLPETDLQD